MAGTRRHFGRVRFDDPLVSRVARGVIGDRLGNEREAGNAFAKIGGAMIVRRLLEEAGVATTAARVAPSALPAISPPFFSLMTATLPTRCSGGPKFRPPPTQHLFADLGIAFHGKAFQWRRDADGADDHPLLRADRGRDAAEAFAIFSVVRRIALGLNLGAFRCEIGDGRGGLARVDAERRIAEDVAECGAIESDEQRLTVSGAVERNHFACLSGDRDNLICGGVVDEERVASFADREVDGLVGLSGELLHVLLRDTDEHRAPVVAIRETPHRGAEDKVLATDWVGEETASLEGEREAEYTAAINPDEVRKFVQRNGFVRVGNCFQNGQAAVEALDGLGFTRRVAVAHRFIICTSNCAD